MRFLLFLILILSLGSCQKEPIDEYKDGGIIPEQIVDEEGEITLVGTKWVLSYYQKGFVSEKPNDVIHFVDSYYYTINDGTERRYVSYQTMDIGNPHYLCFYDFTPFGDNGIWSTNLGRTFIEDGEINLTVFESTATSTTIKGTFNRIE
jgi:hypothetical protein